jgi:hypothetical protein
MKTKTINVYEYKELSETAKEKAKEWFLSGNDISFEWNCMKDDAKNIGISLKEYDYRRYMKGELLLDFTQVLANIIKEHGKTCETYKTAKQFQSDYMKLTEEQEEEKEELESEFLRSILEDYRILMDKDCDYRESEEYISEMMEANDYEFDENGKIV